MQIYNLVLWLHLKKTRLQNILSESPPASAFSTGSMRVYQGIYVANVISKLCTTICLEIMHEHMHTEKKSIS